MSIFIKPKSYLYYKLNDELSIYIKSYGKLLINIDIDYVTKIYNFQKNIIPFEISKFVDELLSLSENKIIMINPSVEELEEIDLFNTEPYTIINEEIK